MIRFVYIVDDDPGIRCELGDVLKTRGMNVVPFASGEDLLDALDQLQPGCILLDLNMPGRDGLQTQAELVARNACHQVIVLTGAGRINTAVTAIRRGACDFLEKPFAIAGLLAAIYEAFDRLDEHQHEQSLRREARERLAKLSQREREVLALLVEGKPNKIIAYELDLSIRTVEVYRANLMSKLKAKSLSDAVKFSIFANNTLTKAAA